MTGIRGAVFLSGSIHVKKTAATRSGWIIITRVDQPGLDCPFPAQSIACVLLETAAGEGSAVKRLNFYVGDFGLPAAGIEIAVQYREATRYFSSACPRVGLV